uniref:Uncharacterized protein n=1 Tax=Chrysemys picta bellii TaxID=8478 RepID=A0A8C3HLY9_CHRPI
MKLSMSYLSNKKIVTLRLSSSTKASWVLLFSLIRFSSHRIDRVQYTPCTMQGTHFSMLLRIYIYPRDQWNTKQLKSPSLQGKGKGSIVRSCPRRQAHTENLWRES